MVMMLLSFASICRAPGTRSTELRQAQHQQRGSSDGSSSDSRSRDSSGGSSNDIKCHSTAGEQGAQAAATSRTTERQHAGGQVAAVLLGAEHDANGAACAAVDV